jgi:hypothetical protein
MSFTLFEIISTAGFFLIFTLTLAMAIYAAYAPQKSDRIRPLLLPAILSCALIAIIDMASFHTMASFLKLQDAPKVEFQKFYILTRLVSVYAIRTAVLACLPAAISSFRHGGTRETISWLPLAIAVALLDFGIEGLSFLSSHPNPNPELVYFLVPSREAWFIHPALIPIGLLLGIILCFARKPSKDPTQISHLLVAALLVGGISIAMDRQPFSLYSALEWQHTTWVGNAVLLAAFLSACTILKKNGWRPALPFIPLALAIGLLNRGISLQKEMFNWIFVQFGAHDIDDVYFGMLEPWINLSAGILLSLVAFLALSFLASRTPSPASSD